jgi:uncharacterized membrane protein
MTIGPPQTLYHRSLGWHAPSMRRAVTVACIGLIVVLALLPFVGWELAVVGGWDAAALTFLATTWPIIIGADSAHTQELATREDQTRGTATLLLIVASVVSLLGVGFALILAGHHSGSVQLLLIGVAVLTVTLSWTVVNTVYTLHYAHRYYGSVSPAIDFGDSVEQQRPDYRDFAYIAFTIGMCYQVSDTTLRDPGIRRTVLAHALLAYVFGVVIVSGSVSLIGGLAR